VRLVLDQQQEHGSQWAAIQAIASKLGCSAETLRTWVRRAERDSGERPGVTSNERERLLVFSTLAPGRRPSNGWHKGGSQDIRAASGWSNPPNPVRDTCRIQAICGVFVLSVQRILE
jgi:DNA-binding Lrp family transcriptional regulator